MKNGLWLTVLQGCNTLLPLITVPYVTRVLGVDCYGVFTLALNWVTYCRVIVEYGFTLSGARRVALAGDDSRKLSSIYNGIVWSRILLFVLSSLIIFVVCLVLPNVGAKQITSIIILEIIPLGSALQQTWLFQGKQDMKPISLIGMTARILSVVTIFAFVKSSNDLYIYCALYGSTNLLIGVFGMVMARVSYGLRLKAPVIDEIKTQLVDGWYLFTSSAMSTLFSGFGLTVLGVLSTLAEAGAYGALSKIPFVVTTLFSPISQAIFPHVSLLFEKSAAKAFRYIKKVAVMSLALVIVASVVVIAFRNTVIGVAFGREYIDYAHIVVPLLIWSMLGVLNNFLGIQMLVGSGHQKEYSKAFVIGFISNILLCIGLVPWLDSLGAALATMLGELTLTLMLVVQIRHIKWEEK